MIRTGKPVSGHFFITGALWGWAVLYGGALPVRKFSVSGCADVPPGCMIELYSLEGFCHRVQGLRQRTLSLQEFAAQKLWEMEEK